MAFPSTPNRLEAVFVQRDTSNSRYEQINISASNAIVYLDEDGKIQVDKINVWATKYAIASSSGSAATASWASQSLFAFTASFATRSLVANSASWASSSVSSSYSLSSSYSTTASYAVSASNAETASYSLSASYATSASNAETSSYALSASRAETISASGIIGTPQVALSSSWSSASFLALSASVSALAISASYAITSSYALNSTGQASTGSVAFTASEGMYSLDGFMPTKVPFFSQGNHMSASRISVTNGLTVNVYADAHTTPPMERVFYIGRDGNVNTWAAQGFYNDAGGTNAKYWLNYADQVNNLEWSVVSDDFSIVSPWLTVTRSGSAITQMLVQQNLTIKGDVLPSTNLTRSLGTASLQWKNAWIQNVFGTASIANTASYVTASAISGKITNAVVSASWASSSISASYAPSAPSISASYAATASYAYNAGTASLLIGSIESASYALSSSFAQTASFVTTAATASFISASGISGKITNAVVSASWASSSLTANTATSATTATTATTASYSATTTASGIVGTPQVALSASWASSSISASYSGTSSVSISASWAPAVPSESASYAATASYAYNAGTASLLLGSVESASYALTASYAQTSDSTISASYSISASNAGTASVLLGSVESSTYALSASFASASISASYALSSSTTISGSYSFNAVNAESSSYPWNVFSGSPYHLTKPVGIGTLTLVGSRLSVLETTTNHTSASVVTIQTTRTDTQVGTLDIRNLAASGNANARSGILLTLGPTGSLEGGSIFVTRTATPAQGLVNGLNITPNAASSDIGIRTGAALSGSVSGPQLQIKANGSIGIGVASPTNARLHIGGTELAFYNATIRLTNGSAGGADVFMAATDDAWGGSITGKFLIGTGDPASGTPILQLYPPSASVGIGIANNLQPQAKLHVQGDISASLVTASLAGTASWAHNVLLAVSASFSTTASYAFQAVSASWAPSAASEVAVSASWASQSLSSSYALSASHADLSDTASYSLTAISASYAPGAPAISASYAITASFALNGGGQGAASSRAMVLCAGFTPYLTGEDVAEIPVPYESDGTTPLSWSVNRVNLRVQLSGSTTSSITIQKSSNAGLFVPEFVTSMSLNSSSYETSTGSFVGVVSGDKVRFYVHTIGTAQYWTITTEITSL
jgi:hypothetical protein